MIQEYSQFFKLTELNLSFDFLNIDLKYFITKVVRQEVSKEITMQVNSDSISGFAEENRSKHIKQNGKWISHSKIFVQYIKAP